jgi:hypothetical protein
MRVEGTIPRDVLLDATEEVRALNERTYYQ